MRIEMLFFNFVASLVLMSLRSVDVEVDGQNTRAPKAPTRVDLFVNRIQVKYEETALHEWRFHNGGRQVVIVAGPLTGDGNMFLYDIDRKQIIDECIKRRQGVTCADWAK